MGKTKMHACAQSQTAAVEKSYCYGDVVPNAAKLVEIHDLCVIIFLHSTANSTTKSAHAKTQENTYNMNLPPMESRLSAERVP
jgi:hypothetical protein